VSGLTGAAAKVAALQLVGSEDHVSARLVDETHHLACLARRNRALADLVSDPPPLIWPRMASIAGSGEFQDQLKRLLAIYGDRNGAGYGSEATVGTPTWRERPDDVLRLAATFLPSGVPPPQEARHRATAERMALSRSPLRFSRPGDRRRIPPPAQTCLSSGCTPRRAQPLH